MADAALASPALRRRGRAVAAALGALAAAGLAPAGLWPLTLLALAAIFRRLVAAPGPGAAAWLGWAFGAGYFAVALSWIIEPFLVNAARDGWMAPVALALMAGGLALFWAGAAALATLAPARARAGALVAALTLAEVVRGWILTGFPWAEIGQIWIGTPAMQLAAWAGPHALTLLALAPAVLVAGAGWRRGGLAGGAVIAAAMMAGALRPAAPAADAGAPVVRIVQPNAAQHLKWHPEMIPRFLDRSLALTAEDTARAPDLVVWPETSVAYMLEESGPVLSAIARAAGGAPALVGIQRRAAGYRNAAVVIGPDGAVRDIYDKAHLVPFGEYMPLPGLAARMGIEALAAIARGGYTPGPGARLIDLGPLGRARVLICYEAIFPGEIAAAERPRMLIQITNDGWFGRLTGPYQHLAQARLRAVEHGLPMLRAANTGVTAVIDADGRVRQRLGLGQAGQITAALPAARAPTLYARLGDGWLIAALAAGLAAAVAVGRRPVRR